VIVDVVHIQTDVGTVEPSLEIFPVLVLRPAPGYLADSDGTGPGPVFCYGIGVEIFRPVVALHAEDIVLKAE
jgi:hypothetical protein